MCHLRHNFFHLRNSKQKTLKESLEPNPIQNGILNHIRKCIFDLFKCLFNFCGVIICKGGVVLH